MLGIHTARSHSMVPRSLRHCIWGRNQHALVVSKTILLHHIMKEDHMYWKTKPRITCHTTCHGEEIKWSSLEYSASLRCSSIWGYHLRNTTANRPRWGWKIVYIKVKYVVSAFVTTREARETHKGHIEYGMSYWGCPPPWCVCGGN